MKKALKEIRHLIMQTIGHADRRNRMDLDSIGLNDDLTKINNISCDVLEKIQRLIDSEESL